VYSNLVAVPRDGESEPLAQIYSFQATPSPQFLHRATGNSYFNVDRRHHTALRQ